MKARIFKIVVVLFGVVGGAFALLRLTPSDSEADAPDTRTARPRRGDLVVVASASGTVRANVQVDVKSRASRPALRSRASPSTDCWPRT